MSEDIVLDEYDDRDVKTGKSIQISPEKSSFYLEDEGYIDDSMFMYHDMYEARKVTKQQMCMWYLKYRLLKFLCLIH